MFILSTLFCNKKIKLIVSKKGKFILHKFVSKNQNLMLSISYILKKLKIIVKLKFKMRIFEMDEVYSNV